MEKQDFINESINFGDNISTISRVIDPEEMNTHTDTTIGVSSLPLQQTFPLSSLKKNLDFYQENSLAGIMKKIENADDAFLNSILAYCCYKDNLWTIEKLDQDISAMSEEIEKGMKNPDALYNLKMWYFNKMFFQKIDKTQYFMPAKGSVESEYGFQVNYSYQDGQYSAMDDLAHASVLLSKHPSGNGNVLNIAFRGTEFSRLPAYISSAYPDMTAYYQNFLPFEEAIMKFARNPANNIKEIQVSGHSLGGAMVQEFLSRHPAKEGEPEIHGFTYGSPGSKKNLFVKFLNIGYHLVRHQTFVIENEQKEHDPRLNEFYHSNDPVPKIGLLGYTRNGIGHNLFDKMYADAKKAHLEKPSFLEKLPAFGKLITSFKESVLNKLKVRFHDSKRYTLNIRGIIEEHYKLYPHLIPEMNKKTQYWQDYLSIEKSFKGLTIKYKTAFEYLIQTQYPEYSHEDIQNKILSMREQIKYDSQASLLLSKKHSGTGYSQNFLGDNNSISNDSNENIVDKVTKLRNKYKPVMDERRKIFVGNAT